MHAAMPQSKLVPDLIVDHVNDMFSSDATAMFQKCRKLKGGKLYSECAIEETITISSEDEDNKIL